MSIFGNLFGNPFSLGGLYGFADAQSYSQYINCNHQSAESTESMRRYYDAMNAYLYGNHEPIKNKDPNIIDAEFEIIENETKLLGVDNDRR